MIEFEVVFNLFGKAYRTKLLAKNQNEAEKKVQAFVLSKMSITSCEKTNAPWNKDAEKFAAFESLLKEGYELMKDLKNEK